MSESKSTTPNSAPARKKGKLNTDIIFHELTRRVRKPLREIAVLAGSRAKKTTELCTAVTQKIANDGDLQLRLEQHKEQQKIRALKRIAKAEKMLDYEKLAESPEKLGAFMIADERLLHDSVKLSSEEEQAKQQDRGSVKNLSTSEIELILKEKREKIEKLNRIIEGEVIE